MAQRMIYIYCIVYRKFTVNLSVWGLLRLPNTMVVVLSLWLCLHKHLHF